MLLFFFRVFFMFTEVKEKEGKKPLVFPCVSIAVEKIPVKLEAEGKYYCKKMYVVWNRMYVFYPDVRLEQYKSKISDGDKIWQTTKIVCTNLLFPKNVHNEKHCSWERLQDRTVLKGAEMKHLYDEKGFKCFKVRYPTQLCNCFRFRSWFSHFSIHSNNTMF